MKKIFSFIIFLNVIMATGQVNTAIDWPGFMAQHDLIWEEIPKQWNEVAFVGNGQVGMMVYANIEDNRLDFKFSNYTYLKGFNRHDSLRSKTRV